MSTIRMERWNSCAFHFSDTWTWRGGVAEMDDVGNGYSFHRHFFYISFIDFKKFCSKVKVFWYAGGIGFRIVGLKKTGLRKQKLCGLAKNVKFIWTFRIIVFFWKVCFFTVKCWVWQFFYSYYEFVLSQNG